MGINPRRRGYKGANAKPMTLADLQAKITEAIRFHGPETDVGVMLSGNQYVMPLLDVAINKTKARVTLIANFTDNAQRHKESLT